MVKKLPLGIADFDELIHDGYIYVDKTALLHTLITTNKFYFLSRPRRFGKTLLISTLQEIFKGNKDLFKGTSIYASKYSWESYPVMYLDFGLIPYETPQILQAALERYLQSVAEKYDLSIKTPSLVEGLKDLVEKLHQKTGKKIVLLIDEYDRAITRQLSNIEMALANRDILQDFFTAVKSLGRYFRFMFITGVSKFAQVSLFSTLNYILDITLEVAYSGLVGYTEKEISSYFDSYLQKASEQLEVEKQEVLDKIRQKYNGYRFSAGENQVYNPYAVLNFLNSPKMVISNYWYNSASPDLLFSYSKQHAKSIESISGIEVTPNFFGASHIEKITLPNLMWETGYLTIRNYNAEKERFLLDYPNQEVKDAFLSGLLQDMTAADAPTIPRTI